jgi:RNA polymerase sigma factor (sigma-70 family)
MENGRWAAHVEELRMRNHDDAEFACLIREASAGSQIAAAELAERYYPLVMKVVRRRFPDELRTAFDSIDFAQLAWKSIFRCRSRIGQLETEEAFTRFLAAVAINKVNTEKRRLRQQKHNVRRECTASVESIDYPDDCPTPSKHAIAKETLSQILENVSERDQLIIRLRRSGCTTDEIGKRVGLNGGSVRRILGRIGRETLG